MNNKLILVALALLLVIPISSADLGTFRQGDCVNIKTILNTTAVNISTLSYPNTTIALTNVAMTKLGSTFDYSFCNTQPLGVYTYDYFDVDGNVYVNSFTITPSGYANDLTRGIIYTILLFGLSIVAFLLITNFFSTPSYGWKAGYFSIFWIVIDVIAFLCWSLANNYLYDIPFLASTLNIIWITFVILTPIIFLIVIFSILKNLAEEGLIERQQKYGYSREEAESKYRKK